MVFLWLLAGLILLFGFVVFRGAPYLPSKKNDVRRAFSDLYPINDQDVLVDIGSGDGIVLREAARRGAYAVGYELNPLLVLISIIACRKLTGTKTILADFWNVHFPEGTTVIYAFSESRDIKKMAQKIVREATLLNRPLMFISYGFQVPGVTAVGVEGAHYLYRVEPLQIHKP
jgi:hypothetical protein